MTRLRVVHLVHNFPPEFTGGTEKHVSDLVLQQKEAGLDVSVIAGSETRDDSPGGRSATRVEDWHGVPVTRVFRTNDERFGVEFLPARVLATVRELVRAKAPRVVHLHHWFNLGDELVTSFAPIPVVASFHDAYAACPRFFFLRPDGFFCGSDLPVPVQRCVDCVRTDDGGADLRARVEARRARFAREIDRLASAIVPSEFFGDILVRAGLLPAEKVRALPLGLARAPQRVAHVPAKGKLRIASFGNLSTLKGIDLLFEALAGIPRTAKSGGVELHLYGEPIASEAKKLRGMALGLPVTWHGKYDLDSLARDAARLDLAVFPSRAHETYSLVLEEAIAIGLPVVVSDRGAPPRRIEPAGSPGASGGTGAFGRVVPVEDARALRATLSELMDQPERLAAMRRALPERPQLLVDHEKALRKVYASALGGSA